MVLASLAAAADVAFKSNKTKTGETMENKLLSQVQFDATQAPEGAFQFAADACKFAAAGEENSKSAAITLTARTGEPISHWYWGRIVHDMAGMKSKPVVALDWCHDDNEIVGKVDRLDTSTGNLVCSGSIESLEVGDRADKIIKLSARDVPYEASIYFDPYETELEWLPGDMTAEVNGREVTGPLVIVRAWELRRIAICPSGADSGTDASCETDDENEASLKARSRVKFSLNWKDKGKPMSKTETTPTALSAEQLAETKKSGFDEAVAAMKKFTDKFGPVDGNTYFAAGLSYEAALEKHVEKLTADKATEAAAKLALEQRIASANLGEATELDTKGGGSGSNADAKPTFGSCFAAATAKGKAKTASNLQ